MEISKKNLRCAIYTRKSTSEGLDQDFTTLDAQREAGLNYIKSQKSEGWVALTLKYDDGGFTGANLDRPALQQLLNDIKSGRIDCVVVYKVDRLSRSLLDFTKLLEFFEQHNVTFVSVTQQFNTNTSMGRLTLNILLSFAQFEREMISERTRDKIAAAKKKGRWTGGIPMLGYSINKDKKALVVNEKEAETVRLTYDLYLKHKSLLAVTKELNERRLIPRQITLKNSVTKGVNTFKISVVQRILRNPVYIGKVAYKNQVYDGLHDPIIDVDTFNKVQEIIKYNHRKPKFRRNHKNPGLLSGLIKCKHCNNAMIYTYAKKNSKIYRYYLCLSAHKRGWHTCNSPNINAHVIENAVINCLKTIVGNIYVSQDPENDILNRILLLVSPTWDALFLEAKREVLRLIIESIHYDMSILNIILKYDFMELIRKYSKIHIDKIHTVNISLKKPKNIPKATSTSIESVPYLKKQLAIAWQINDFKNKYKTKSVAHLQKYLPITKSRICKILKTLNLAPKIQEQIISSNNPAITSLTERDIHKIMLQNDWNKQLQMWDELLNR